MESIFGPTLKKKNWVPVDWIVTLEFNSTSGVRIKQ